MRAMTTQFLERKINIIWSITNNYIYSWCPNVSACLQAIFNGFLNDFLSSRMCQRTPRRQASGSTVLIVFLQISIVRWYQLDGCKFWWFINNWGDYPHFYGFHLPCVVDKFFNIISIIITLLLLLMCGESENSSRTDVTI